MSDDKFKLNATEAKESSKFIRRGLIAGGAVQLLKAAFHGPDWFFYAEGVVLIFWLIGMMILAKRIKAGDAVAKGKLHFADWMFGYGAAVFFYYTIKEFLR